MSGAAICTYLNQFFSFSGDLDPTWPHRVLISATVLAGVAVGAGIVIEEVRHGRFWSLPTMLVVFGIAIEAAGTILLFEFDEGIGRLQQSTISTQQSKIIVLETRLAGRKIADRAAVEGKLKPWAKIPEAKRPSLFVFWVPGFADAMTFGFDLSNTIRGGVYMGGGTGTWVTRTTGITAEAPFDDGVGITASPDAMALARAISEALTSGGVRDVHLLDISCEKFWLAVVPEFCKQRETDHNPWIAVLVGMPP